jgi:tRNA(Ile)-lysidine synthase
VLSPTAGTLRIGREPKAVAGLTAAVGAAWDGRWRLVGPDLPGAEVRALGAAGLAECPDWRGTGLRRETLLTTPALWAGRRLIAAPQAGRPERWRAEALKTRQDFLASLKAH